MEAVDAVSIIILRKRSQYVPLRNIISGLWFAILYYRAVELNTSRGGMRKDSRCYVVRNLTACLRAGKEISGDNKNVSKIISKRMRSGLALWSMISKEPGLLAIVNFSNPPPKEELHSFLFHLDDGVTCSTNRYRTVMCRILRFIDRVVRRTESLYQFVGKALRDIIHMVKCETLHHDDDVGEATTQHTISLEASFNKSTHPRFIMQYDSPIFICVQLGDAEGARTLFQKGMALIYDVDPFGLGLLYVWKSIWSI